MSSYLLCVFLVFVWKCTSVRSNIADYEHVQFEGRRLANGTTVFLNHCHKDLFYMWSQRHEPWAKKMLDSYGKIEDSITNGNRFWFGDFDMCTRSRPPKDNLSHSGFSGKYAWAVWGYQGEWTEQYELISSGVCLPSSCENEDIVRLYPMIRDSIEQEYPSSRAFFTSFMFLNLQFQTPSLPIPNSGICCLTIIGFFILLVVLGTALDSALGSEEPSADDKTRKTPEELPRYNFQTGIIKIPWRSRPSYGKARNLFCCFSLLRNFNTIFDTKSSPGQISCLHGIRFFSMLWVILEHVFINIITILRDLRKGIDEMDTKPMQMIIEGEYSVDTFFLLSGLLLTYVFLKSKSTENMSISKWIYFYAHRFLRLSPSFYMMFFFAVTVYPYLGNGPYWEYMNKLTDQCTTKWWTHLLYYSNVVDTTDECLPWTWYLPNDMQFYCLSPIFLVLLKWSPKIAVPIIWVVMGLGIVITFGLSYINEFAMTMVYLRVMKRNPTEAQKLIENVSSTLYTKPYSRMGPYLIGMLLAYYLHQESNRRIYVRKWRMLYFWFLSGFGIFFVLFALHGWDAGVVMYSLYHATSRHIWAASVAWIIYACATGQGGPVNTLLSWKAFRPLSRLCYCTYLVHPLFIYIMYYGIGHPLQFDKYMIFTLYAGIILWSFLTAFAFSMVIETPFAKLEKHLLPSAG